ncbi:hypothetical protein P24_15204 [Oceanibaculum indicum P24]|uniref:Uncharacterized protein n=1 Tax=Oceanibaculum indicum P24 TaxID=1207063 RepID=K2J7J7_9PROT|nr:hypothetical protein P24_15204 [Oceanibaculum indicum P24]
MLGVSATWLAILLGAFYRVGARMDKERDQQSEARRKLYEAVDRCRSEHRAEIADVRAAAAAFKLEVASGYVTAATVATGFNKIDERLSALTDQVQALREALPAEVRPPRRRGGAD